jgi:FkbM family methyltransferase
MNIFLDLGSHKGEGLLDFLERGIIDNTYDIFCFEASPNLNTFEEIKNKIKHIPGLIDNVKFENAAIWIEDGQFSFNDRKDMAAHLIDSNFNYFQEEKDYNVINVKSINFGNFLKTLPEGSNIVCKMDIEGSEFPVLRNIIDNNTIKIINKIYVEFHPEEIPEVKGTKNENINSVLKIVEDIKNLGIEIYIWK